MKLKLPSLVASPQDLNELLSQAQDYATFLSHQANIKRIGARRKVEVPVLSPSLKELLSTHDLLTDTNAGDLETLIESLQGFKHSAEQVTITLAAPVTGEVKRSLVDWCRNNINPNILVAFQFNSTILGGLVVRYGSHIFDWSFRRQLFNNRQKIAETLHRV